MSWEVGFIAIATASVDIRLGERVCCFSCVCFYLLLNYCVFMEYISQKVILVVTMTLLSSGLLRRIQPPDRRLKVALGTRGRASPIELPPAVLKLDLIVSYLPYLQLIASFCIPPYPTFVPLQAWILERTHPVGSSLYKQGPHEPALDAPHSPACRWLPALCNAKEARLGTISISISLSAFVTLPATGFGRKMIGRSTGQIKITVRGDV